MSNYVIANPFIGAPTPVSVTNTTQLWPAGFMIHAVDNASGAVQLGGAMFQYVNGFSASAPQSIGQAVVLIGASAQLLGSANTATKGPVGIAAGAISATNVWGWVQRQGHCDFVRGATAGDFGAVGAPVFVGTTNGQVQTTAGATGYIIPGAFVAATGASVAASTAQTLFLDFPRYQHDPTAP
jgi:hypothetical protein